MQTNFKPLGSLFTRTALALVLAAGVATVPPAFAKEAKPAKADLNSPEFVAAAGPLQKTLAAAQPLIKNYQAAPDAAGKAAAMAALKVAFAEAPAQLAAVQAAAKTPKDKFIAGQWGSTVAAITNDNKIAQHAIQDIVDSGMAPPAEAMTYQFKLGVSAYQNQDFPTATKALIPVVAANYPDDVAAEALALSYTGQNQPGEALAALKTAASARKAAGGAVPNQWLLRANQIAYKAKNPAWGNEWAVLTVVYAPTAANWISSAQLLRIYNGYTGQEAVDLSRLLYRAGALASSTKEAQQEYLDYILTADARRQPGEVLAVIDAGVKAGAISATTPQVVEARAMANSRLAADRDSLAGLYRDAHGPASSAAAVMGTGDAFLGYGDAAKAAELYKLALAKPGVDAARGWTRLGIAQVDAGDYAGAQASFGKVEGTRKPLAQFWLAYVQQKAAAPK